MSNYYDKVFEDFQTESSFDEGILDEGILDEGIYDEAGPLRRRPVRIPGSIGKPSNFGRNVGVTPSANGSYVTKAELKSSLNNISEQVNDLKKTGISLASSLKRLDDGYEKIIKVIARKDKTQDSIMSNTTMMSLLSTIANKPKLNTEALSVNDDKKIVVAQDQDPIKIDLSKTLMFTMLPSLTASGNSSDNSMMTTLMMVLLLDKDRNKSSSNDDTLLLMLPLLMMGNKK